MPDPASRQSTTSRRLLCMRCARTSIGPEDQSREAPMVAAQSYLHGASQASLLGGTIGENLDRASRPLGWPYGYSSVRTAAAILRTRSGSAILPSATVKPTTVMGRPRTVATTPAAPLTSAGRRWTAGRADASPLSA